MEISGVRLIKTKVEPDLGLEVDIIDSTTNEAIGEVLNTYLIDGWLYADINVNKPVDFSEWRVVQEEGFISKVYTGPRPIELSEEVLFTQHTLDIGEVESIALYALSEVLPGVSKRDFMEKPDFDSNSHIKGHVQLDGQQYYYDIFKHPTKGWVVDADLTNKLVVELSDRIKELEAKMLLPLYNNKLISDTMSQEEFLDLTENPSFVKLCKRLAEGIPK